MVSCTPWPGILDMASIVQQYDGGLDVEYGFLWQVRSHAHLGLSRHLIEGELSALVSFDSSGGDDPVDMLTKTWIYSGEIHIKRRWSYPRHCSYYLLYCRYSFHTVVLMVSAPAKSCQHGRNVTTQQKKTTAVHCADGL